MPGVNLSMWGSIPEGSERFRDESRGRQCSFMTPRYTGWITIFPVRRMKQVNCSARWTNWILICQTRRIKQVNVNKLNANLPNETNGTSKLPARQTKEIIIILKFISDMIGYWVTYRVCKSKISMTFWYHSIKENNFSIYYRHYNLLQVADIYSVIYCQCTACYCSCYVVVYHVLITVYQKNNNYMTKIQQNWISNLLQVSTTLIYCIFLTIANSIFLHGAALHFHHGTTSIIT